MFDLKTLEEYKPIENKVYRILDDMGKLVKKSWQPILADEEIIASYQDLLFARTADQMAISYQRQGRMYTYPPNLGQEAIHIAAGKVIRKEDWLVPAFRELGAWLAKGVKLSELFLYFKGHEDGSKFVEANRVLPISVPISSQLLHASGLGYSMRYQKEDAAVFAFVGDGGTSEGDFHEALNFAAVWDAPVVFIIQNNQFAISVPLKMQTRSINLAVKGLAYNIPSVVVDGNDFFAMHEVLSFARSFALEHHTPFLIEAQTYRLGAHTTSDDPSKYRSSEEEEEWQQKDPQKRLQAWLINKKLWDASKEEELIKGYKKMIDKEFSLAENYPKQSVDEVFDFMYAELPNELKRQKNNYQNYLISQGGSK